MRCEVFGFLFCVGEGVIHDALLPPSVRHPIPADEPLPTADTVFPVPAVKKTPPACKQPEADFHVPLCGLSGAAEEFLAIALAAIDAGAVDNGAHAADDIVR